MSPGIGLMKRRLEKEKELKNQLKDLKKDKSHDDDDHND